MDPKLFENGSGRIVKTIDGAWAFVPNPLPPKMSWDGDLSPQLARSSHSLGNLSGLGESPNLNSQLLIYPFIRREAVLSSAIEGTQSSLSDLLLFEATKIEKQKDVKEVQNYVEALEHGIKLLEKLPLSLRFIREIHKTLMQGVRGSRITPGQFRNGQNWIGPKGTKIKDATYVPPPVQEMNDALDRLEHFLHEEDTIPPLMKAALIHYQFEAIHPFWDGNGRVGRLLVVLFLIQQKLLSKPLLYLSAYFERNRSRYYELLSAISQRNAWKEWIEFFLQGVESQSQNAIKRSRELLSLQQEYHKLLLDSRMPSSTIRLLDYIFMRPVITISSTAKSLKLSYPTVNNSIKQLKNIGILKMVSGRKRYRVYSAERIMRILEAE